ncbi:MAG: hypothetical protein AAAFM81_08595 [Pseudomonadota bacterium]
MELYLRAIPNLDVAVDGFTYLNVIEETNTELHAVGISYVLQSSAVLIETILKFDEGVVKYEIRVGIDDALWRSLSESKRWKVVYLYASEGAEPTWTWGATIEGHHKV